MDIQLKKVELIEWITQISDVNIISKMDKIRRAYLTISKENINPMSLEEFYASIERAEEDIKFGRVYTQEEVEKESESW
jgi:predicted transcriptional regulator